MLDIVRLLVRKVSLCVCVCAHAYAHLHLQVSHVCVFKGSPIWLPDKVTPPLHPLILLSLSFPPHSFPNRKVAPPASLRVTPMSCPFSRPSLRRRPHQKKRSACESHVTHVTRDTCHTPPPPTALRDTWPPVAAGTPKFRATWTRPAAATALWL